MGNGPIAFDALRLLIERCERLDEEIAGLKGDRKDVIREMKAQGYCTRTAEQIMRERKVEPSVRRDREALLQIYRGGMGLLDGTPLGNYALEKLSKQKAAGKSENPKADGAPAPTAPPVPADNITLGQARDMGRDAARSGQPVTANPFPGGNPCRAAWDEAWCAELGSDGMDIPEALRPKKKQKGDDQADKQAEQEPAQPAPEAPEEPAQPEGESGDLDADSGEEDATHSETNDEETYGKVRAFVLTYQRASVTLFRKNFQIGYSKASAILARLEADGVVSAADATGNRTVLLDQEGNPK